MGYTRAYDMAQFAGQAAAIHDHLTAGTYPPLGLAYEPLANDAVSAVLHDTPDAPLEWRGDVYTAAEVVERLRLDAIVAGLRD